MNNLDLIKNLNFKISWKLIYIGLYGFEEIPKSLSYGNVLDYLDSLLTDVNEQTDDIVELICEKDDHVNFDKLLKKLADKDDSDTAVQKRKWKVCLLKTLLDGLDNDPLRGLLELMEFWVSMEIQNDCPQTFPNKNDKNASEKYFTEATYKLNVNKNREWLNREIEDILVSEK